MAGFIDLCYFDVIRTAEKYRDGVRNARTKLGEIALSNENSVGNVMKSFYDSPDL